MRDNLPKEEALLQKLMGKPDEVLEVESRLKSAGRLGINIGQLEGAFLQALVSQTSVEKVVEIGSQFGCSALYIAQSIGKSGEIYLLERDQKCLKELQSTFFRKEICKFPCKVRIMPGEALASLKSIESEGPFDLVFIDADKGGYVDYYLWAKRNLRPGGYLVADNVFLFGSQFLDEPPAGVSKNSFRVMGTFLREFFNDPSFQASLIPTREGLAFGVKLQ